VDNDRVSLSNLHRQILYYPTDIGHFKTEVAAKRLRKLNDDVTVNTHTCYLDRGNVDDIIPLYDIIIDGSDNFATRFLVNTACVMHKKPLISGAVSEWEAHVAIFCGFDKKQPCYQCFCPSEPAQTGRMDCSVGGVTGALTGLTAQYMAMHCLQLILQIEKDSIGKLLRYSALTQRFKTSLIIKDPCCNVCSGQEKDS
jgi:adenylyltransferase/sulfurtransferase